MGTASFGCPSREAGYLKALKNITPKAGDKALFEALLQNHPNFLNLESWTPGPDPPDIFVRDRSNHLLGLELTEWLDEKQTTHSITIQEHEIGWLQAINSSGRPRLNNFSRVTISFRNDVRFNREKVTEFCKEFHQLLKFIDSRWMTEIVSEPFCIWRDFERFPTLQHYVQMIWFPRLPPRFAESGQGWWVTGEGKGGAYDPEWTASALIERIKEKIGKAGYSDLKSRLGLSELILLLHYGIRGLMHNTPFEGVRLRRDEIVTRAKNVLASGSGPFNRVFLYFAFNQGELLSLYP